MRQGQQNRRGRGRNNRKGQSPLSRNFESNGPDVKIRGSAAHIAEKYMSLARDAMAAGDLIIAENYLQHAEHCNRIIMAAQAQSQTPFDPMNGNGTRPGEGGSVDQGEEDEGDEHMRSGPRDSFAHQGGAHQGQRDQGQRDQSQRDQSQRDQSQRDPHRQRFDRRHDAVRQPPGLDDQPVVAPNAVEPDAEFTSAGQNQEAPRPQRAQGTEGSFRRDRPEGEGVSRGPRRRGRPPGNGVSGERRHDQEPRERQPAAKDDSEDIPQG